MEPAFPRSDDAERPAPVRLFAGVLISPRMTFEDLRETPPSRTLWLVPLLMYILVAAAGTQLVAGLPGPSAELRTLTERDFLPQLEEYVHRGTMTREQTDWLRRFITPGTAPFFATQAAGTAFTGAAALFFFAFFFRHLARSVLRRDVPYRKSLEIVGLAFVAGVAERIVTTTLIAATGSLYATPGPGLLFIDAPASTAFLALSSINLFTLWQLGIVGTGLACFTGRDLPKVLVLLLALWALWTGVMLFPVLTAS